MEKNIIKQFQKTLSHFNITYGIFLDFDKSLNIIADHDISAMELNGQIKIKLGASEYERFFVTSSEAKIKTVKQYNQLLYKYICLNNLAKFSKADKQYLPANYLT
jgi:hypothetical protein